MAHYDKKTKTWRVHLRICGKRIQKRGFLSKQIAEIWEKQQVVKFQQDLVGLPSEDHAEIPSILDAYLDYSRKYKTPKSAKREESSLNHFRIYFKMRHWHVVREIHDDCIYPYLEWREKIIGPHGRPPSTRTLNLEMETIRRCFEWAVSRKLVGKNPFEQVPLFRQKKKGLPRYLTTEEIATIEGQARAQIKTNKKLTSFFPAFFVLVRTGMRSDELCQLDIANIDFVRKQIILRPEQTKGNEMRSIPMEDVLVEQMKEYVDEAKRHGRERLFASSTGNPQTPDNLNRRFRNLLTRLEKQGLVQKTKEIHIHSLRRTYISHMIMAGVDPVKVMAIVGHQEWSTIKRYLVLAPGYVTSDRNVLPY